MACLYKPAMNGTSCSLAGRTLYGSASPGFRSGTLAL